MATLLYNDKHIIGRLFRYFSVYFSTFATPTAESLFLLILVQRCVNSSEKQCLIFVSGQGGGRRQCGGIVD